MEGFGGIGHLEGEAGFMGKHPPEVGGGFGVLDPVRGQDPAERARAAGADVAMEKPMLGDGLIEPINRLLAAGKPS